VEELNVRYQVPKRLATAWLDAGRLILLLDGLDEVREDARAACVDAINAFAHEHAPAGLAVTCRVVEYSQLKERLRLRSAICLQPLTPAQIDAYFERAGAGLENLRVAMRDDAALRELAQTPLMLSVMTMAWRDAPAESLRSPVGTVEQRRVQLLEAYVQTALRRRPDAERSFSDAQVRDGVSWLAKKMHQHGLTLFSLEQLQPSWLDGTTQPMAYFAITRVLAAFVFAIPFWILPIAGVAKLALLALATTTGLLIGALDYGIFGWELMRASSPSTRSWRVLGLLLLLAMGLGGLGPLLAGHRENDHLEQVMMFGNFYLMFAAAALGVPLEVKTRDIRPADIIQWSWRLSLTRALAAWAGVQLVTAIVVAAGIGALAWSRMLVQFTEQHWEVSAGAVTGMILGTGVMLMRRARIGWMAVGALAGAMLGIELATLGIEAARKVDIPVLISGGLVSIVVAVIGGFEPGVIESMQKRRSGLWFWLRVPLLAALGVGAVIGMVPAVIYAVVNRSFARNDLLLMLTIATSIGGAFGMVAFFRFGGFQGVQHLILRSLLVRCGRLPRRTAKFLERAATAALLQKVGFGYRFIHKLLLDHLAERAAKPKL
jgi:uncharacterized protein YijF (DUF1287 family)